MNIEKVLNDNKNLNEEGKKIARLVLFRLDHRIDVELECSFLMGYIICAVDLNIINSDIGLEIICLSTRYLDFLNSKEQTNELNDRS